MREMQELSPITYFDTEQSIRLNCYADTFVYHKASGNVRNLVAMRFGGYPEQVKAMADVLRKGAGIEAVIENHNIILRAQHNAYKRSVTHDGVYAEATMLAMDDVAGEMQDEERMEVDNPTNDEQMQTSVENVQPKVLSMSEKLKKAMLLVKQARGIRDGYDTQEFKDAYAVGEQLTLFDLAS